MSESHKIGFMKAAPFIGIPVQTPSNSFVLSSSTWKAGLVSLNSDKTTMWKDILYFSVICWLLTSF